MRENHLSQAYHESTGHHCRVLLLSVGIHKGLRTLDKINMGAIIVCCEALVPNDLVSAGWRLSSAHIPRHQAHTIPAVLTADGFIWLLFQCLVLA